MKAIGPWGEFDVEPAVKRAAEDGHTHPADDDVLVRIAVDGTLTVREGAEPIEVGAAWPDGSYVANGVCYRGGIVLPEISYGCSP